MNHDFAIDLDIKGFFDTIDHELMMKAVKHYCPDKWVLMYVERWPQAGIFQNDGTITPPLQVTPQGGVISPLLANLFLHVVFDKWMEVKQFYFMKWFLKCLKLQLFLLFGVAKIVKLEKTNGAKIRRNNVQF